MQTALVSSFVATLLGGPLASQMVGTYAVDPGDPNAFPDLAAAVAALLAQGVGGPVEIEIAPGTYVESVTIGAITGAGPASSVIFRPRAAVGSVVLQGDGGDTIALQGAPTQRNRSLVFEGLVFTGAPGHAISATSHVEDIEIRDCRFDGSFVNAAPLVLDQSVIHAELAGDEIGWRVHHNDIAATPATLWSSRAIELHHAGEWEIHHNTFRVEGAHHALYLVNSSSRVDRIYDNLFVGTMAPNQSNLISYVSAIRADLANYENDIVHNTFAIEFPAGGIGGCCIASGGTVVAGNIVQNHILGNVFVVRGPGYAISLNVSGFGQNPIHADGNVYFGPSPMAFRVGSAIGNGSDQTFAGWQAATGQDGASQFADPLLQAPFGVPPDLRPTPQSPIVGAAVGTPPYVVDDFRGRLRDPNPDAGAYESTGFATYGVGCAGTGQLVPVIGSSGTLALGSSTFAIELSQAAGSSLTLFVGGASRDAWLQQALPFDLGGGCALLVSLDAALLFVTSFAGDVTAPMPIPADPQLFGSDLFFQWAVLDPGSGSALGVAMSAAGAVQL